MFRSLFGFAVFAVVAMVAIKFVFGLIGFAIGMLGALLWFAFLGFMLYLVIRLLSPSTADRIRDTIRGTKAA